MGMVQNKPGMVLRKGDADAGSVLVALRGRSGVMVLSAFRATDGELAWLRGTGPEPVDEATADAYITKQTRYDSDLWVIEFDAGDYLPPFEGKVV
jgi:hypothetical protein